MTGTHRKPTEPDPSGWRPFLETYAAIVGPLAIVTVLLLLLALHMQPP